MSYMNLPNNDRDHVLLGQRLPGHPGHAIKYHKDNGHTVLINRLIDYAYMHHINLNMKNDKMEERPGHPGYPAYIRNKLLHAATFGTLTPEAYMAMETEDRVRFDTNQ